MPNMVHVFRATSARPRWWWPAPTALAVLYLLPFVRVLSRIGDEGTLTYGAQRVAEGALPYRDFVEPMGPACFWWLGAFFRLFGTSFLVARGQLLLTGVFTALLLYWMTRRRAPGPGDWWPALFVTAVSIPLWPGTSHHWDSNLFFLAAVALFLRFLDGGGRLPLVACGIMTGVVSCFMQQKGAYLAASLALALALSPRSVSRPSRLGRVAVLLLATAAPLVVVIVFYAVQGQMGALYEATVRWPLADYSGVNVVPYAMGVVSESVGRSGASIGFLPIHIRVAVALLTAPAAFLVIVLPAVVGFLGFAGWRRGRLSEESVSQAAIILPGVALYLSELHRPDFFHLVYGCPLLLVAAALLFKRAWPSVANRRRVWIWLAVPTIAWAACLLADAAGANTRVETRRGPVWVKRPDEALNVLLQATKRRDTVFVYPYYPMYYFLADLTNPTRFSILVYGYNTQEQFREAAGDIVNKRVGLALWDTWVAGENLATWCPGYRHPPVEAQVVERAFATRYRECCLHGGWRFLRRSQTNP